MERRLRVKLSFTTPVLGIEVAGEGTTVFPRDRNGSPCISAAQIVGAISAAAKTLRQPVPLFGIEDERRNPIVEIPITGAEISHVERMKRFPGTKRMVPVSSEATLGSLEFFVVTGTQQQHQIIRLFEFAGRVIGIGQHRRAGYGRFTVVCHAVD